MLWINLILNGLLLGGIFSLTAFGLSLAVGVIRIVNIAHGDFAVLSAYLTFSLSQFFGLDPFIGVLIIPPVMFVIGYFLQKFILYKVLSTVGFSGTVLATFALSIIVQNLLLLAYTADDRSLAPQYLIASIELSSSIYLSLRCFLGLVCALAVFIAIYLFSRKTYIGKAIRAVPFDKEAAEMIGINPRVIYCYAFGIALSVTAIAGIMLGIIYSFDPSTGPMYLLYSFSVVVLGGLGSLRGTLVGGLILGELISLGGYFFGSTFQLVFCYVVVIILLYLRPQGLFRRI